MLDNKNVFTLRNNKLVSINKDHAVIQSSEMDVNEPYLQLPPITKDNEDNSAEELHEESREEINEQTNVGTRRPLYEENFDTQEYERGDETSTEVPLRGKYRK